MALKYARNGHEEEDFERLTLSLRVQAAPVIRRRRLRVPLKSRKRGVFAGNRAIEVHPVEQM